MITSKLCHNRVSDFPHKYLFSLKYCFKTADVAAAKVSQMAFGVLTFKRENRYLNVVIEEVCFTLGQLSMWIVC